MKNEIFNLINPSSNDNLSLLKDKDLRQLLFLLNNYYLELRDTLGLPQDITFGLELEYEHIKNYCTVASFDFAREKLDGSNWIVKYDSTLDLGLEINSKVLTDKKENWLFLDDLCEFLKDYVSVGKKSGGHIHVGTPILGDKKENWLHLLRFWSAYENVIYRFTNGEFLTGRQSIPEYAMPKMDVYYETSNYFENRNLTTLIDHLKHTERYQAINFWNVKEHQLNDNLLKNTIEFRSPNSSLESIIWQNNVNFLTKMLLYCKSNNYNEDLIAKRYKINGCQYNDIKLYDEIYLDQVLELVDLIFDNNLDKIYFLKQYLKSFELPKENGFSEYKTIVKKKK